MAEVAVHWEREVGAWGRDDDGDDDDNDDDDDDDELIA
jgi:hypothetical protein